MNIPIKRIFELVCFFASTAVICKTDNKDILELIHKVCPPGSYAIPAIDRVRDADDLCRTAVFATIAQTSGVAEISISGASVDRETFDILHDLAHAVQLDESPVGAMEFVVKIAPQQIGRSDVLQASVHNVVFIGKNGERIKPDMKSFNTEFAKIRNKSSQLEPVIPAQQSNEQEQQ